MCDFAYDSILYLLLRVFPERYHSPLQLRLGRASLPLVELVFHIYIVLSIQLLSFQSAEHQHQPPSAD